MIFCKECGQQLKEGAVFCGECGTPVKQPSVASKPDVPKQSTEPVPPPVRETRQSPPSPPRKPLSKKAKVLTATAAALAILLIGSYYIIGNMLGAQSIASEFIEAVQTKDVKTVKEFINDGQLELSVDDKQTEAFVTYLHEDPRRITAISERLKQDTLLYESDESAPTYGNDYGSSIVMLNNIGKKWLLFDHYTVQIRPAYMEVSSSEDRTVIYLNDQEVGAVDSKKEKAFGPFLPGAYTVKAVVDGEYGKVEQEIDIDFLESEASELSLTFDWFDYYTRIYSTEEDAFVYINGKSTKKTVKELDALGPIPMDGSLKVYAQKESSSGVQKSEEITIEEDMTNIRLPIERVEPTKTVELDTKKETAEKTVEADSSDEEGAIINTIVAHYGGISSNDFSAAYNHFSASRKKKVSLAGWEKGLQENIRDDVTTVEVKNVNGNAAKAYIEMTSYDNQEDGTILVQEWDGHWNLVKENGQWTLNDPELQKIDSRIE